MGKDTHAFHLQVPVKLQYDCVVMERVSFWIKGGFLDVFID